jgi:hypothetical protein
MTTSLIFSWSAFWTAAASALDTVTINEQRAPGAPRPRGAGNV